MLDEKNKTIVGIVWYDIISVQILVYFAFFQ